MGKVTLESLASALISVFEGSHLTAYQDSGGVWTIGKGHTGPEVKFGVTITKEQEELLFAQDQMSLVNFVNNNFSSASLAGKAAYISFGYNCGMKHLKELSIGTDSIDNPIHYTNRRGVILSGLQARRRLEFLLTQV